MADKNKLAAVAEVFSDPIDEAIKEATKPDLIPCTSEQWEAVESHLMNIQQAEQAVIVAQQRFQGVLFMLAMEYKVDLSSYRFDHSKRGFVKV